MVLAVQRLSLFFHTRLTRLTAHNPQQVLVVVSGWDIVSFAHNWTPFLFSTRLTSLRITHDNLRSSLTTPINGR